jgi:hypothetical protein
MDRGQGATIAPRAARTRDWPPPAVPLRRAALGREAEDRSPAGAAAASEAPSRHENPQPRAAAARQVQAQRRCRAAGPRRRCRAAGCAAAALPRAGGVVLNVGVVPRSRLCRRRASPSARIDPRIAAAARSPGVLPLVPGSGGSPRLAEPGRSPPTGCRRRRCMGWLRVAWTVPAGPAPPAPRRAAPRAAGWSGAAGTPGGRPPGCRLVRRRRHPGGRPPPDDAFVFVGD